MQAIHTHPYIQLFREDIHNRHTFRAENIEQGIRLSGNTNMQGRGVASKSKRANRGGEGLTLGPDSGDGREDVRDCEELQAGMSKTGGQGRAPGEVADSCLRGVTGTSSRRGRGHADELRREEHDRRGEPRPRAATAGRTK